MSAPEAEEFFPRLNVPGLIVLMILLLLATTFVKKACDSWISRIFNPICWVVA